MNKLVAGLDLDQRPLGHESEDVFPLNWKNKVEDGQEAVK